MWDTKACVAVGMNAARFGYRMHALTILAREVDAAPETEALG